MQVSPVLRHRDFNLYWFGVVVSQIGTRGAIAANLYQVYELSHSTFQTGLVGLSQAVALLVLSPVGGAYADRLDRRKLLQATQLGSFVIAAALALLTFTDTVTSVEVLVSVLLTTAAATFDQPARQALIPAMVPRQQLPQAFALINPTRELAVLLGPALAGLLIAARGPELMYATDAATYLVLVIVLAFLRTPPLRFDAGGRSVWHAMGDGARFLRRRPLVLHLMGLDLSATLFGAYQVVLPALALDVMHAGPTGYGLLAAAPSAGALIATYLVFRVVDRSRRLGLIVLLASAGYGAACLGLAQARLLVPALVAGLAIGACDALATTIRQAAVQLETPDDMRGRVTAVYQMASRGGPALGNLNVGWWAGVMGPITALSLGAVVPVVYAGVQIFGSGRVRRYTTREPTDNGEETVRVTAATSAPPTSG